MAITSLDQLIAAPRQRLSFVKTASVASNGGFPFSVFDAAGNPAAGVLAVGNTTTGVVPTDAVTGYPVINAFTNGAGNAGYIAGIQFGSSVACRMFLYDCLFSAGAFAFNANVALSGQPSYASRVPGGTDFKGTELWIEAVTNFTGNQTIAVTYTNQDGVAGRTTGAIATGVAPIARRMLQLPLQAGDSGVQRIESVVSTVSTVGTFNVHVMRRLWSGRVRINSDGDNHDFLRVGMPQIFHDSALRLVVNADSTATGIPELLIDIVNG